MSRLVYSRTNHTLTLYDGNGNQVGQWTAYNNTVSGAADMPMGTHDFSWYAPHPGGTANSSFGSNGNFIFEVPGRTGMGVHSGRGSATNNPGPQHPTNGCIRTTDAATQTIRGIHASDPLSTLTVLQ
jgi:hypothetical protein